MPGPARPQDDYITEYTDEFRLVPEATALVIVDLQYATASWEAGIGRKHREAGNEERVRWRLDRVEQEVIPNLQRLLGYFRTQGLRVVYVTSGSEVGDFSDVARHFRGISRAVDNRAGRREHEIREEVAPRQGEIVVNKTSVSALNSSSLEAILRAVGAEYLLFAGVSTDMCVDSTARDAVERGFRAVIVEDCCSAAKPEYHDAALVTFQRLFGRASRVGAVLAELEAARTREAA